MATGKVVNQKPTGTFTCTPVSAYVASGSITGVYVGDVVQLNINGVKLKSGTPAWTTIFTIPDGFQQRQSGTASVPVIEAGKTMAYLNISGHAYNTISMFGMVADGTKEYSGTVTYLR